MITSDVTPIIFVKGAYYIRINGVTHKAGRRRTLRRLAQRRTGIIPETLYTRHGGRR